MTQNRLSLAELVTAGNFKTHTHLLDDCHAGRWTGDRGDRVRGKLLLLHIPQAYFTEGEAERIMHLEGRRLRFANAYELLEFASSRRLPRWNGHDKVIALGCKFDRSAVAMLGRASGQRVLELVTPDASNLWPNDHIVLCVRV